MGFSKDHVLSQLGSINKRLAPFVSEDGGLGEPFNAGRCSTPPPGRVAQATILAASVGSTLRWLTGDTPRSVLQQARVSAEAAETIQLARALHRRGFLLMRDAVSLETFEAARALTVVALLARQAAQEGLDSVARDLADGLDARGEHGMDALGIWGAETATLGRLSVER